MVLVPIRIFSGSLGGATLYQNPSFVSPNEERAELKKNKGNEYVERVTHKKDYNEMREANMPPEDVLAGTKVFRAN